MKKLLIILLISALIVGFAGGGDKLVGFITESLDPNQGITINESIKVPDHASPEFNGVMLSNYDSLIFTMYSNYFSFAPKSIISFNNYDFLCVDLIDSKIYPNDFYTNYLHFNFSQIEPLDNRISLSQSLTFESGDVLYSGNGLFGTIELFADDKISDYSVIFDLRNKDSVIKYYSFINGKCKNFGELDPTIYNSLYSISYEYVDTAEYYDQIKFGGINIYAFESGVSCSLSNYFDSGSLYDCKDSLLYGLNN